MIKDEVIDLTRKLVSFKSTSDNHEEILRCADFIEEYFEDEEVYVKTFVSENVPSVYVSLHDKPRAKIILSSHFDVVPAADELFEARLEGNHLMGRGTYDDKGPLAFHMVLLKELSKLEEKPNVALLTTGDEETGGINGAGHALQEVGGEFAIVTDGGGLNKYSVKAKGAIQIRMRAKGSDAHGSRPWEGENAIVKLIGAYREVDKLFPDTGDKWRKTINLGNLRGGEAVNQVPSNAELSLDIRFTESDDPDLIMAEIERIGRLHGIETDVEEFIPVFFTDQNNDHFKHLMMLSGHVFGDDPETIRDYGASDARYFSKAGIPSVLTCPGGGFHHSEHEYLDVSSIPKFYNLLKTFALERGLP